MLTLRILQKRLCGEAASLSRCLLFENMQLQPVRNGHICDLVKVRSALLAEFSDNRFTSCVLVVLPAVADRAEPLGSCPHIARRRPTACAHVRRPLLKSLHEKERVTAQERRGS